MANEISISITASVKNGTYQDQWRSGSLQFNQNAQGANAGIVGCTVTAATLPVGAVITNGMCFVANLDATNNIDIGLFISSQFYPLITLKPSEQYCFRVTSGVSAYVRAEVGTPKLQFWLLND